MSVQDEQEFRFEKLIALTQDIDFLISESVGEKQLATFGMLLMVRGLKCLRASYGDEVFVEKAKQVIDAQLSETATSPRGWDSSFSRWDSDAFFSDKGGSKVGA